MAYIRNFRVTQWRYSLLILILVLDSVGGDINYSIVEEQEPGAFVGNIANDLGLDVSQLLARRFQIVSGRRTKYLDVNLNTGILFIKEKIDREKLCEQRLVCFLMLEAVIQDPLKVNRVEVEILDINDNAPAFKKNELRLEISEKASPGARFPLQRAYDPDTGTNSVRGYKLSQSEHFTLEMQTDSEQSGIPELVIERPLNREQQFIHELTLTAFDGGIPEKFGSTQIKITVLDVNDNVPVCEQNFYQITIAENVPKDTVIVKVNAVDMDEGLNGEVVYSFSDQTPDKVHELFSLDTTNGEIRVIGNVDFEEAANYQISVQAKDRGLHAVPVYCKVLLQVTDVNDHAPEIMITSASSSIPENAPSETTVAVLRATDRDSEELGNVYCHITRDTPFKLDTSFNNYYTVLTVLHIDREEVSEYNITIICTDAGSPPLTTNKTIRVQVSDINDNAPRFTQTSFTMYVTENNGIGVSIGSVSAFDPDVGKNAILSYSMTDKLLFGLPPSTFVSIDSASGVMFAQRSFDYEELRSFQVLVQAKDSGSPPLSNNVTVNVIIVDQNDNVPVILSPLTAEETMPGSAEPGYLVTKVTATDADTGQNARLSYELFKPTDGSLFTVASETGEIWTIRRFGVKDSLKQKLVVLVRDDGKPSLSSTVIINLSVLNYDSETAPNVNILQNIGASTSDLRFYLIISFGIISFVLFIAIIVLAIKVHKSGVKIKGCCCSENTIYGTEKSSVNIQIPSNYMGVCESEILPGPFRYEVYPSLDSALKDFMFSKLNGPATPKINTKTGTCVVEENGTASYCMNKETIESHQWQMVSVGVSAVTELEEDGFCDKEGRKSEAHLRVKRGNEDVHYPVLPDTVTRNSDKVSVRNSEFRKTSEHDYFKGGVESSEGSPMELHSEGETSEQNDIDKKFWIYFWRSRTFVLIILTF
ncbi:protocadherin-10-like [Heterodontus francisci]|uniref:protocadherin-10-like n=1 Tax=Heterodontus francisci TaxID=7792 RepID=UPI00355B0212